MQNGVFISYRHKDTEGEASRLSRDVSASLPQVTLFRDVEAIAPGEDFVVALESALGQCKVMLVLIGPFWLDASDNGKRRLDDPADWTRLEVAGALRRGIRVIPVLCRGAELPNAAQLPGELEPLTHRQAVELDNNRWDYDVDRLIDALAKALGIERARKAPQAVVAPAPKPRWRTWATIGAAIFGGMVLYASMQESQQQNQPVSIPGSMPAPGPSSVQAPASSVNPAATPAPAASAASTTPGVAQVAGTWVNGGDTWQFVQQGAQIEVGLYRGGVLYRRGLGRVDVGAVVFDIEAPPPNTGRAESRCQAVVSGDIINGSCFFFAENRQAGLQMQRVR